MTTLAILAHQTGPSEVAMVAVPLGILTLVLKQALKRLRADQPLPGGGPSRSEP